MRKFKKKIILIPLLIVGVLFIVYASTIAKYVSDTFWNYYLNSKGFYFSSDNLDVDGFKNVNNLWDGGVVSFNIRNNLNEEVMSDYDINYTATCNIVGEASLHAVCRMNGSTNNIQDGVLSSFQSCVNNTNDGINVTAFNKTDCELGGYDWTSQIVTSNLYFEIVLTDSNYTLTDVVVNVEVESTSPYRKTLIGEFNLHKLDNNDNVSYIYKNYSNYDRLVITNPSIEDKCIRITWDSNNLLIDSDLTKFSSYTVDSNGYINNIELNISAKNNDSYIFYKRDFNEVYDLNAFNIDECS